MEGHVHCECLGMDYFWVGQTQKMMQVQGCDQNGWEVLAWINGKRKRALVDTGCGKTLVHSLKDKILEESVYVKCIHGDSVI